MTHKIDINVKSNGRLIAQYPFFTHDPTQDVWVSGVMHRDATWEVSETAIFMDAIKDAKCIVDAGANIGWYSVLAGHVNPNAVIHSFEPFSQNFSLLERNVSSAPNLSRIHLNRKALSNKTGSMQLTLTDTTNFGDFQLSPNGVERETPVSEIVETITLDDYLQGQNVDVLKIDTQGSEHFIFEGFQNSFSAQTKKPVIFVEYWPLQLCKNGVDLNHFFKHLEGYDVYAISRNTTTMTLQKIGELVEDGMRCIEASHRGFWDLVCFSKQ